jgi:hypothetical protein
MREREIEGLNLRGPQPVYTCDQNWDSITMGLLFAVTT